MNSKRSLPAALFPYSCQDPGRHVRCFSLPGCTHRLPPGFVTPHTRAKTSSHRSTEARCPRTDLCRRMVESKGMGLGQKYHDPCGGQIPGVAMAWRAFSHAQAEHTLTRSACRIRLRRTTPPMRRALLLTEWKRPFPEKQRKPARSGFILVCILWAGLKQPRINDRSGEGWEESWPFSRLGSQLPPHHRVHTAPFPSPFLLVVMAAWHTPEEADAHQMGLRMGSRSFG